MPGAELDEVARIDYLCISRGKKTSIEISKIPQSEGKKIFSSRGWNAVKPKSPEEMMKRTKKARRNIACKEFSSRNGMENVDGMEVTWKTRGNVAFSRLEYLEMPPKCHGNGMEVTSRELLSLCSILSILILSALHSK